MNSKDTLIAARSSGDPKRIASALVGHANALADGGDLDGARALLDEAAGSYRDRRLPVDQARCLVFAATLSRATGDLDGAAGRAREAESIAPAATAPRVSAATELGEIALLRQAFDEAAACYGRALEQGQAAGLTGFSQAALLRKRAQARAALGQIATALPDLERAHALYLEDDQLHEARRTSVERASALESLGRLAELMPLLDELRAQATAADDFPVLADIELLAAARAISEERIDDALAACLLARQHALAGTVPVAYTTAAMSIAELHEADGDRVAAYEALAVGWATVGDLLGDDVAKATFAPKLQALRERWGDEAFIEARDMYYQRRRAQGAAPS